MPFVFRSLLIICRQNHRRLKFDFPIKPTKNHVYTHNFQFPHTQNHFQNAFFQSKTSPSIHSLENSLSLAEKQQDPDSELAIRVQNTLKKYRDSPVRKIELALDLCCPTMTQDLVLKVLKRHRSDWKPAYIFFNWVSREGIISLSSCVYNEILDILGRMRRFEEFTQVLDEMSKREGFVDEDTYRVLVNRYAGAHMVEEAIGAFNKRRELGLELDLVSFQKLLMYLCRYKHVDVAETLLNSKGHEFGVDIKTMNIVLNGWCVLGNVREAKRFWKDIIASKCKPDVFTYGTFIKALTNKGKLGTAMKLYEAMWEMQCKPDVVICNCIIDALCFKKRVPQALAVFEGMKERGCLPNVATYNSLIKHMCKIGRMQKVYKLLDEMQEKKGSCMPDEITFNYLLKSLKKPEEVSGVLERMEVNGCKMNIDTYNLLLKLHADWDSEEKLRYTWEEMEKNGLGLDRRSYTIMIHWLYGKGRVEDALCYIGEMENKGIVPEPRTKILLNFMISRKQKEAEEGEKSAKNDGSIAKVFP
ncbi:PENTATRICOPEPTIDE REPEAT-CONTAINING PROTEIN [Salix viminalis]|uniref:PENTATRICOPEPTIDE REPEAT-CONTAINING PROTEIN n=1 Tax=Salix viminalis TaxID=40686 RepID=A0A9Q0U6S4_SALVM|nr:PENTATRICOPEPTIDE REPEAT-CONTAINING PROTEIN [Salix viminalis]